jgi:hypothetical protein
VNDYAEWTGPRGDGAGKRLLEAFLVVLIFLGSLVLWLGIPAGWIWLASQLVDRYPSVYAIAIVACPATMAGWGWVLYRIYAVYVGVRGVRDEQPRSAWLKSLSAERGPRRPRSVLDVSMTVSVIVALLVIAIWFFFFAHNYGPALGN